MTAIETLYECKFLQTYGGLKELIMNIDSGTAAQTIDLLTVTSYKNTKAVVDAATAKNYNAKLGLTAITVAKIRYALGVISATGVTFPVQLTSASTLTIGAGPSTSNFEIIVCYK